MRMVCCALGLLVASATQAHASPEKARVLYSQAVQKYAGTDFDAALQLLQQATTEDPDHAESLHLYGVILLQTKRYADAEAVFKNLFQKAQIPQTFFELGLAQFRLQKYRDAEGSLLEATRVEPQRAAAWYMLAMAQYEQHDYSKSAENFRFAAQFSTREDVMRVASEFYRGEALLRAGNDPDARRAFASVVRDGPNTVFADLAKRGGTLQGDSGEAGAYAALGIQFDSNPLLFGTPQPANTGAGRGFFDGGLRYVTPVGGPVDLGMGLAFYQSLHFNNPTSQVDLTAPTGNVEIGFRFSDKPVQDRLSFGYTGGVDLIQGFTSPTKKAINFYSAYHRPYARFELREGDSWYTSFGYTFRFEQFNTKPGGAASLATAQDNRDFIGHDGRVAQHFLFPSKFGRASGGILFRFDDAKGTRWDLVGGGFFLDGEFTPVKQVALRLSMTFAHLAYIHEDRVASRGDTSLGGTFGVRYWFIENLGVHGDVGISKQWSPVGAFDYTRFVASFYMMARL